MIRPETIELCLVIPAALAIWIVALWYADKEFSPTDVKHPKGFERGKGGFPSDEQGHPSGIRPPDFRAMLEGPTCPRCGCDYESTRDCPLREAVDICRFYDFRELLKFAPPSLKTSSFPRRAKPDAEQQRHKET